MKTTVRKVAGRRQFGGRLLVLVLAMAMLVAACGGDDDDTETTAPAATEVPAEDPTAQPTAEPTEEPTAEPSEEPTAEPTEEPTAEPTEPAVDEVVDGMAVYLSSCAGCHGADGTGTDRGPSLEGIGEFLAADPQPAIDQVTNGGPNMPAFGERLTEGEIVGVVDYLVTAFPAVEAEPASLDGMTIFTENCAGCHGADGTGTDRGPSLEGIGEFLAADPQPAIDQVTNGGFNMPAFGDRLAEDQVVAVVDYITTTFAE